MTTPLVWVSALLLASMVGASPVFTAALHKAVLRKIPVQRDNEHSIMAFQRHQNSAVRRLHQATGHEISSSELLQARTLRRRKMLASMVGDEIRQLPRAVGDTSRIPASPGTAVDPASTTIVASGTNRNGFSETALEAISDLSLTKSTGELIDGGEAYIIELNDIGYLIEVEMGTPSQTFLLLADTGSGDTWVASRDERAHPRSACTQCGRHTSLGPDVSSTFRGSNQAFSVTYGSGAVAGTLCSDTMTIAGMTLGNQSFGVALQESVQFSSNQVPFDGLMGLSFSALSQQGVPTPLDALRSSGQIDEAILGIALGRITDGANNCELVFGAADTSKFDASTIETLKVSANTGFWQVEMAAATVNGAITAGNRQAILDTGTSLIIAPEADAAALHAQIQGSRALGDGMFTIPCTTTATVALTFGNTAFQIDVRDLIFQPVSRDLEGDCISSISAGAIGDGETWLLGDTFLKNIYMTTNTQRRTVEFSARTDSPGSSSFGVESGIPAAAANTNSTGINAMQENKTSAASPQIGSALRSDMGWPGISVAVLAVMLHVALQ